MWNNDFFFFLLCCDTTKGTENMEQLKMAHNGVTIHLCDEKNEICSSKLGDAMALI